MTVHPAEQARVPRSRPSQSSGSENLRRGLLQGPYRIRLAFSEDDLLAAFRLRFSVFNIELHEGLQNSSTTGLDTDEFDPVCDHLIVEWIGEVVGTYRLQTGTWAKWQIGYYSEREFDFAPYERVRNQVVELGRACIHREHRSTEVLHLLWRGIAEYAMDCRGRYLLGCSSLTSQDPAEGFAVFNALQDYLAEPDFHTVPQKAFRLPSVPPSDRQPNIPKLLRTYLAIGAKICGPPGIDREFKTIDFLTLLDLQNLHPRIRARFFPK